LRASRALFPGFRKPVSEIIELRSSVTPCYFVSAKYPNHCSVTPPGAHLFHESCVAATVSVLITNPVTSRLDQPLRLVFVKNLRLQVPCTSRLQRAAPPLIN
jgi:hypothetical protein